MNFISQRLFNFVQQTTLKSQFSTLNDFVEFVEFPFDQADIESFDPKTLFYELTQGTKDLKLIQVFSLMGWDDHLWHSTQGKVAMQNWWLSALEQEKRGEPLLKKVMVIRTILADMERYPAPKDVVKLMRNGLNELIQTGQWHDKNHLEILQALINTDSIALAKIAIQQKKSILSCIKEAGFPQKLPIIHEANLIWLKQWISEDKLHRQSLRHVLNEILHQDLDIKLQHDFASVIFNHTLFSGDLKKLEFKVKEYPELVAWLSQCARQSEFKNDLNAQERQALGVWIGTGNYESLLSILMELARKVGVEGDITKTENRYIFWKNYQNLFQEAWLLLPSTFFTQHKMYLMNVKEMNGSNYPMVLLKIQNYFVFQSFFGDASQNNLLMTDDVKQVEHLLNQKIIFETQLKNTNLVLIHDHCHMWQTDLAYCLHHHFQIKAQGEKVYFAASPHAISYYLEDAKKSDFIHERKQGKYLPKWVKENLKYNFSESSYQKAALTAKRYNLV